MQIHNGSLFLTRVRGQRGRWWNGGVALLLLTVGLCALLVFPATAWGQAFSAGQWGPDRLALARANTQVSAQIDSVLTQLTNSQQFSGSVLVAQRGQVLLSKGYSMANWDTLTPNTPDTRFYLASLTKAFTAMSLLILQDQGKLHVQDHLCAYIANCPPPWQSLSIQELLTHTSGIAQPPDAQLSFASPAAWIASFDTLPLQFTPGGEFQYCSTCYQILAYVVQQVSGMPYEQFVQQMILNPLGMSETGFDVTRYYAPGMGASGYESWRVKAVPAGFQTAPQWSFLFGSGLLYSNVKDLYRWDQALYTTKLVSQPTLDLMFTPHVNATLFPNTAYGYGWFISQTGQGHRLIWHYGLIDGFRNYFGRAVDDDVTVIILSNLSTLDAIALGHRIENMVLAPTS